MKTKLYVLPGSHPCEAVIGAAKFKGIEFQRVDIPPAQHKIQLRLMGFGGDTVPAAKLGDEKIMGSRKIMRAFESFKPEPTLFPKDPDARAAVEEAERWGDGEFQDVGRRLLWGHFKRDSSSLMSFSEGANLPLPDWIARLASRPVVRISAIYNKATDANIQNDLRTLPVLLDKIDKLVDEGVIGNESPNVADFQILSSLALWMTLEDVRPAVEARKSGQLALKLFPNYPGHVPGGILPAEWLAPLRESATAA